MSEPEVKPRILFVSPEVLFIPVGTEHTCRYMVARGKKFANDLAVPIVDLYDLGVDVHAAKPDYRQIFSNIVREVQIKSTKMIPADRIHLTEDRAFFYSRCPDSNCKGENIKISVAFQREVINQVIPRVQPDLIHCHDWTTGLIPPMAKEWNIPCLYTLRNCHSAKCYLSDIEDIGIDAAGFWQYLFYDNFPGSYEQTRDIIPADFLLSGVFSASFIDTPAPACLMHMIGDQKSFFEVSLRQLLAQKWKAGFTFTYNEQATANHYINAYERMLQRPIIDINWESRQSSLVHSGAAV